MGVGKAYFGEELTALRRRNIKLRSLAMREQGFAMEAETKVLTLERELQSLTGSNQKGVGLEKDANLEKRVQDFASRAVRRMRLTSIIKGWTMWQDAYYEHVRKRQLLQSAAARMKKPKLVACYAFWRDEWVHAKSASMEEQLAEQVARGESLGEQLRGCRARVVELEHEIQGILQRADDANEEILRKEEEEKAKRIETFCQQAARRIKNQGIIGAWTQWQDVYYEVVRQQQLLRSAGARLSKPQLVATFTHWREDWEEEERTKAEKEAKGKLSGAIKRCSELEEEIRDLKVAYDRQLAAAEERHRVALEQQKVELTGSVEEQMALLEEQEKAKRIEAFCATAARRIKNAGIIAAWTTWQDVYFEVLRQRQLLQSAGARLSKPQLAATFSHWREDWEAQEHEKELDKQRERMAAMKDKYRQAAEAVNSEGAEKMAALEAKLAKVEAERAALEQQASGPRPWRLLGRKLGAENR